MSNLVTVTPPGVVTAYRPNHLFTGNDRARGGVCAMASAAIVFAVRWYDHPVSAVVGEQWRRVTWAFDIIGMCGDGLLLT